MFYEVSIACNRQKKAALLIETGDRLNQLQVSFPFYENVFQFSAAIDHW